MRTLRAGLVAALTAAMVSCGGSPEPEVVYDGTYVPCKGVTMDDAQGSEISPEPEHPSCP